MNEYAFYLRKSRADAEAEKLGQGETLARHLEMLKQLAEKNGVTDYDIYKEIVSGETISARPEMQRLLEAVWNGQYKAVFVVEVERLARGNTKDQGEVAEAFQYSHTKIITMIKTYDPDDEYDQEFFEFSLFMSRREYQTIKRRMQAGRAASKMSGNYTTGRRVFGYDILKAGKDLTLTPNAEEAPYVQLAFDMAMQGNSAGTIASRLNQLGIRNTNGSEFSRNVVLYMLRNPVYIGKIRWFKDRFKKQYDRDTNSYKSATTRNPEYATIIEGKHKPIISEEDFNRVQEIIPTFVPRNREQVDPFAGLFTCAVCGERLRMFRFKDHPNYIPHYFHLKSSNCGLPTLRYPELIDELCLKLTQAVADFDLEERDKPKIVDLTPKIEAEIEKERKKRTRLFDAYEDGIYSASEFSERKGISDRRLRELESELEKQRKLQERMKSPDERRKTFYTAIEILKSDEISAAEKNNFLKSFIAKIVYTPAGMEVFFL